MGLPVSRPAAGTKSEIAKEFRPHSTLAQFNFLSPLHSCARSFEPTSEICIPSLSPFILCKAVDILA
jgi:hypothetical protein